MIFCPDKHLSTRTQGFVEVESEQLHGVDINGNIKPVFQEKNLFLQTSHRPDQDWWIFSKYLQTHFDCEIGKLKDFFLHRHQILGIVEEQQWIVLKNLFHLLLLEPPLYGKLCYISQIMASQNEHLSHHLCQFNYLLLAEPIHMSENPDRLFDKSGGRRQQKWGSLKHLKTLSLINMQIFPEKFQFFLQDNLEFRVEDIGAFFYENL